MQSSDKICDGRYRKRPTPVTNSLARGFTLAGADVGLGLRPKNVGASISRVEDRRLLTGQGMFTADGIEGTDFSVDRRLALGWRWRSAVP
jgi:hypothetical protein